MSHGSRILHIVRFDTASWENFRVLRGKCLYLLSFDLSHSSPVAVSAVRLTFCSISPHYVVEVRETAWIHIRWTETDIKNMNIIGPSLATGRVFLLEGEER